MIKKLAMLLVILGAIGANPTTTLGANPTTTLTVNVTPSTTIALAQKVTDPLASTAVSDRQITVSAIPLGQTVFGTILWETSSNPGATGTLDTIKVGNQTATVLGHFANARFQGDGLGITVWWLPNVQGSPTTIDYVSSTGGFWYDSSEVSVFSGIPANATVDAINGAGYSPTGCCSTPNDLLASPNITPSASGDFLYGTGVMYDGGGPTFNLGSGWIGVNVLNGTFNFRDEWQVDNLTSPIAATFQSKFSTGAAAYAAIVAIK